MALTELVEGEKWTPGDVDATRQKLEERLPVVPKGREMVTSPKTWGPVLGSCHWKGIQEELGGH